MDIGSVFSNIGISICLLLGLIAIFKPQYTKEFVGISASSIEGESEIKATYGGFFVGLAVYAFILQSPEVFAVIGYGWLAAAFVRLVTICINSYSVKNIGGVIFETVLGMLCLSITIT